MKYLKHTVLIFFTVINFNGVTMAQDVTQESAEEDKVIAEAQKDEIIARAEARIKELELEKNEALAAITIAVEKAKAEKDIAVSEAEKKTKELELQNLQALSEIETEKKIAEGRKAKAEAQKAQAEAEIKSQQASIKAKFGDVEGSTFAKGEVTLKDKAGDMEATLLAAKAINDIALQVRTELADKS